ncbi:hypothetical protein [Synechococcus sp. HK05]|uniref:hypothetical protein n=1 Tax=Synechococcus sp. HK05 TaxID=2725975 RepID=UPI0020CB3D34|nr:hypothetical protein [Synechococcus sp. HK05]
MPMRHLAVSSWLAAVPAAAALVLACAPQAQAGSITAESMWNKKNAIERAEEQLPANATVTNTHCTVVNVTIGNYRYICTVDYTTTPTPPANSESSAPAP